MLDPENWGDDDENDPDYVPPDDMENGHVTSNTEESDSSDEDNQAISNDGQFDTDLPTAHRYLGKLNNVSGYTLYDDGEIIDILAIYTTTMVFPGFTLPLVMNDYVETSMMLNFIKKNNVFVLLCGNFSSTGIFNYCVTMEIFETQIKNNVLNIKARGRQRCKLVAGCEIKSWSGRLKQVTIKILAEPEISTPIWDSQLLALKQKRLFTSTEYCTIMKNYKYRRYHLAQYPIPSWVYDKYEISYYVTLLLDGLSHYVGEYIPKDPIKLSYWFVQNYQLGHDERLQILKLNSALDRLKLEYGYLKLVRTMCCSTCGIQITDPSKVFAMSKDGIQSNYVNPGGHVYETVTVKTAENFHLEGNPSRQFSWFPGYAWTIMRCKSCSNHLGWQFTSTMLKPSCFYGLAKIGFKVVIHRGAPSERELSDIREMRRTSYASDYIII